MSDKEFRPKENLRTHILMVCDHCRGIYIAKREDFEKKAPLKKAIYMTDTCPGCTEQGNFYEDQWYYEENGLISKMADEA